MAALRDLSLHLKAALQVHWPGSGQPDGPPDCACAYPNGTTIVGISNKIKSSGLTVVIAATA